MPANTSAAAAPIFKAYDIRGEYGKDLTDETAYKIGRAFVDFTKCRTAAVGRDVRAHSPALFKAFSEGAAAQGADIIDLGECSTPMSYFGTGLTGADAGVMITASHLSAPFNGFKLSRANAVPVSGANGIQDIGRAVAAGKFAPKAKAPGKISRRDISAEYAAMVRRSADIARPLRIVADCAFAMGIWEMKALAGLPLEITPLYGDLQNKHEIHEANPLEPGNMRDLQKAVRAGKGKYDFGVAFDADADRVGFVDETGAVIPMDITAALIAKAALAKHPKAAIGHDLRSSKTVAETIAAAGGAPFRTRVGHAFIKEAMRARGAWFAGELSGHYYFRTEPRKGAVVYGESSALAVAFLASAVAESGAPLSALVKPVRRNFASGEINTRLAGKAQADAALSRIREKYADEGWFNYLDGVTVDFPGWWFNVRCSNTEPLIRLNLESTASVKHMAARRDEVLSVIRGA